MYIIIHAAQLWFGLTRFQHLIYVSMYNHPPFTSVQTLLKSINISTIPTWSKAKLVRLTVGYRCRLLFRLSRGQSSNLIGQKDCIFGARHKFIREMMIINHHLCMIQHVHTYLLTRYILTWLMLHLLMAGRIFDNLFRSRGAYKEIVATDRGLTSSYLSRCDPIGPASIKYFIEFIC